MLKDSRQIAIEAIQDTDSGAPIQEALDRRIPRLAVADRHLCSDLAYGTLRNRIRLRHVLGQVLKKPERLPQKMRIALEIAVYSLLFQDKIPPWAVLDETVKIVKKEFGQKLANVANGSLHSVLRLGGKISEPQFYDNPALFHSLPDAIFEIWQKSYGAPENLLGRSAARPYSALRLNRSHPEAAALEAALLAAPEAIRIGPSGFAFPPGALPALILNRTSGYWRKQGAISFQAAGSQLILAELGLYEDWREKPVWDACCGMGGKTHALLEAGINVELASDTSRARLAVLTRESERLGLAPVRILQADAASPPLRSWGGNILVDAPCSGLGVLARRPDLKARFSRGAVEKLSQLQRQILAGLYATLAPGGELCYLTCTLNPAENEKQIEWARNQFPDLEIVREWQTPADHPWLEGMYGARLKKKG